MAFQESARSLHARLHVGAKAPLVVGVTLAAALDVYKRQVLRGRHHRRQAACVRGRPRVRRSEGGVVMTRFDARQPVAAAAEATPPVAQTVLGLHGQSTGLSGTCETRLVEGLSLIHI